MNINMHVLVKDFGKPPFTFFREGAPFFVSIHSKHGRLGLGVNFDQKDVHLQNFLKSIFV